MLIGEAPGYSEDVEGKPFVGAAGKFLETLLLDLGFSRADVFICNVLKCRPPRNRPPRPEEIQTCTPYLDRQIKLIKPKLIITLGSYSTAYIFFKANQAFSSITQVHGRICEATINGMHIAIFPTFHPASSLYSETYKQELVHDFELLKKELAKRSLL
jgi:DNA polymerase